MTEIELLLRELDTAVEGRFSFESARCESAEFRTVE